MPKHMTESVVATITAKHDFTGGLKSDVVSESTSAAGVSIDQVLCKDAVVTAGVIPTTFIPAADDSVDLGSATYQFKDAYIDGKAYIDELDFNGTAVSATAAELNLLDGVTSTTAELNILDGVTATYAELNQCDGVGLIVGDTTSGRVLRVSELLIYNATAATEIRLIFNSVWNGDSATSVDNIGKSETVSYYSLGADGNMIIMGEELLTGTAICCVSATIQRNLAGTAITVEPSISGNDLRLDFWNAASGISVDLTTLVDTGAPITVGIVYLTSA